MSLANKSFAHRSKGVWGFGVAVWPKDLILFRLGPIAFGWEFSDD